MTEEIVFSNYKELLVGSTQTSLQSKLNSRDESRKTDVRIASLTKLILSTVHELQGADGDPVIQLLNFLE